MFWPGNVYPKCAPIHTIVETFLKAGVSPGVGLIGVSGVDEKDTRIHRSKSFGKGMVEIYLPPPRFFISQNI